jgi:hypothetical protein
MSAFSLETSGLFDEDDGRWSTFNLDVGTGPSGPQSFRAVVSTSSFSALLPDRLSCVFEGAPSNCSYSRGVGQYQGRQNSGYDGNRSGSLVGGGSSGIELVMLGGQVDPELLFGSNYSIGATVWVDYISLRGSSSFQNIHNPVPIYSVKSLRYLLAMIGVGYGTHELANRLRKDVNSTLLSMVSESAIPSPSWAYTAGAYYGKNIFSTNVTQS